MQVNAHWPASCTDVATMATQKCDNVTDCSWSQVCISIEQDNAAKQKHNHNQNVELKQQKSSLGKRHHLHLGKDDDINTVDCAALVPETETDVRKYKREICNSQLGSDDRLSSHEFAGDFALRYYLSSLFRNELVRSRQKRSRRRGYRS